MFNKMITVRLVLATWSGSGLPPQGNRIQIHCPYDKAEGQADAGLVV